MNCQRTICILSFIIILFSCGYFITRLTNLKIRKDLAEDLKQLTEEERKLVLEKSKVANQVFASYNKSI